MSSKIVFTQHDPIGGGGRHKYIVQKLVNRTRPAIGTELTEDEVQKLQRESEDLTIEIGPSNRHKRK